MLGFVRPPKPPGFEAAMRPFRRAVRAAIAAGIRPDFEDLWGAYKDRFIEAQHGKCAYCEAWSLNHPGAVEHHAPKTEVHELEAPGAEVDRTSRVRGRTTPVVSDTGYWWLAYAWDNWLFACERCNSAWKRCLFPVREVPRRLPPRQRVAETPLVLHPFGRVDPVNHLEFSAVGQISARRRSVFGEATIATCGLDRESLRRARERRAADTHRHVDCLLKGLDDDNIDRARDAAASLLSLGAADAPHAGMVRGIIKSQLRCSFAEVAKLARRLARLRATPPHA
jgi:hypothetical protein